MNKPSPRRLILASVAAAALALGVAAPAGASNPLDMWFPLGNLNAANGAGWVREYANDLIDPLTIYAATEGDGVYVSHDDGFSWGPFNSGLGNGHENVRTIYFGGGKVWAGTTSGLWASPTGGFGSWQPVAQGPEDQPGKATKLNEAVQAVLSIPGGNLLAGVVSGGVYRSGDGGQTWTPPAPGNGMSSSTTVWSFASFVPGIVFAATSDGIYRSLDGGASWTLSSDGISGTTLRVYKDGTKPNIYYAASPDNGVFRSVDAGFNWTPINGSGSSAIGNDRVRALTIFSGVNETRLYAGTENGLYVGRTGNNPINPGPVKWRHATNTGLGSNTIFWALTQFKQQGNALIAGTMSNGGYALIFTPPANTAVPTITAPDGFQIGKTLIGHNGTWSGTPDIEFEYQWQYCTDKANVNTCTDIDDATEKDFSIPATYKAVSMQGKFFRIKVTASNDFPTFGKDTVGSQPTQTGAAAKAGSLPGETQQSAASVAIDPSGLPQAGDTITAQGWTMNPGPQPAGNVSFDWYRCDVNGNACDKIDGEHGQGLTLRDADVGHTFRVVVIGTNNAGTRALPISGATNEILAPDPVQLADATLVGLPYPGESLVSTVGVWQYPGTTWKRQWEQCDADGTGCSTISGENGSTYTVRDDDLGHRLRVRIAADSNGDNKFPGPAEVFTPQSDLVVVRPPDPVDGGPGGGGSGGPGGGGGGGGGGGSSDTLAPTLGTLKLSSAKVKKGGTLKLKYNLSEGGSLSLKVASVKAGRKKGKKCVAGGHKGKRCTVLKTVGTIRIGGLKAGAGTASFKAAIGKKKLAPGNYQAVVTPLDAAGNKGKPKTIKFKVTK